MANPAVSKNLDDFLRDVLETTYRRCEDCKRPVTLAQGYYYNFVTGQYWHRACPPG